MELGKKGGVRWIPMVGTGLHHKIMITWGVGVPVAALEEALVEGLDPK